MSPSRSRRPEPGVPNAVRLASDWSWRLIVIALAVAGLLWLFGMLGEVVIPVIIALLLCGLLVPYSEWMQRYHIPKWLAVVLTLLSVGVVLAGLSYLATNGIRHELVELSNRVGDSIDELRGWLIGPPFDLTGKQVDDLGDKVQSALSPSNGVILSGVMRVGTTLTHLLTGLLLALFTTLFVLIDGRGIWAWIVRIFPRRARAAIDGAGRVGWLTLQNFARVQVLVAVVDALGISIGSFALGLPLVIPVGVVVFIGSFIPFLGAVVTGALAVFIALLYKGVWVALIMLAVVIFVQQLESHVLQPLVMGTAVSVHPLAVVLSVATGSIVGGIAGALFAVPLVAVANVMVQYIARKRWRNDPALLASPPRAGPPTGPPTQ